jgi:hypothetical protein
MATSSELELWLKGDLMPEFERVLRLADRVSREQQEKQKTILDLQERVQALEASQRGAKIKPPMSASSVRGHQR